MREGISGLIPSLPLLCLRCLIFTISRFYPISVHFLFAPPSTPLCLVYPLQLCPLSLWQTVMWLHLIAVEINKASKFVFFHVFVTQRKGDVIWEV